MQLVSDDHFILTFQLYFIQPLVSDFLKLPNKLFGPEIKICTEVTSNISLIFSWFPFFAKPKMART